MSFELTMLLSPLEKLLGVAQRERHHKEMMAEKYDTKRREALQAIYTAIVETNKYQEMFATSPDREREFELAKLWSSASIAAQDYFGEFSVLGTDKAHYWTSKLKWPRDVVLSKGIDLETVETKYRALLQDA